MVSKNERSDQDEGYFIVRPEKIRWIDILSLFILRRSITSYGFVESSGSRAASLYGNNNLKADWLTPIIALVQKVLDTIKGPMAVGGKIAEFILNLVSLNGGILGILWNIIRGKFVFPNKDSADFRSAIGFIDQRVDLQQSSSLLKFYPMTGDIESGMDDVDLGDLTMMASKVAYENPAFIQKVVTDHWKMNFVGFYDCWNKFLNKNTTQAFIFSDRAEDAKLIVVAFRGTEPFNAVDWSTDVDLSWLFMGKLGNVHLGFLKALGLQDEKNFLFAFPKDLKENETNKYAYYEIKKTLKTLVQKHKNAKIIMTGHSLGAALSIIFPALLSMNNESDILAALHGVMNYGQPRVGDAIFCTYVTAFLRTNYYRYVYRWDVVPRVPFDFPPVSLFKHVGECIFFDGWYSSKTMALDAPNPNYFDPLYVIKMYWNAWGDLFSGILAGLIVGKEYREGIVSILFRCVGLVIPGIACHSPRDYVNSIRLAKVVPKEL